MKRNCPFYGRHLFRSFQAEPAFLLVDQHGNQCALVTTAYAPCALETQGLPVEWSACSLVEPVRLDGKAA